MFGLAAAIALVPAIAAAQSTSNDTPGRLPNQAAQPNASHVAVGTAARDGCVNVPGEMHSSSDCARLPDNANLSSNFSTDASGRPTGASENAERNARIAADRGRPLPPPDRDFDRDRYPR